MIILVPMGGKGSRFQREGYKTNKAEIPVIDRHSGKELPMILCALKDIPWLSNKNNKLICVDKLEHQISGLESKIKKTYPQSVFIHDHVKLDQAFGCFLAREYLERRQELFIGACDNGFEINLTEFNKLKKSCDAIILSHTNDSNIEANPEAHSWAILKKGSDSLSGLSFKKTVSENPMNNHATTGMFWFKDSNSFLKKLEEMIWSGDTEDGKYYVDKVLQYYIKEGLTVKYLDVRYICWGTPLDYENYQKSISYWMNFLKTNKWIKKNL